MVFNWMRGPASIRKVGKAWFVAASYRMDSSVTLASRRFCFSYSVRIRSSPWRMRVWVTGFQLWTIQRWKPVAASSFAGSIFRSPSSVGGPK